jgi:hypothetical protein
MKSILLAPALLATALLSTGCGDMKLSDRVLMLLDPENQKAAFTIEMSDGLQVNIPNGAYPIGNGVGQLIFVPATKEANARIGIEVNLAAVAGDALADVGVVESLPNGNAFPVAITPPLFSIPAVKSNSFKVNALTSISPEFQLGATVGISQMSSKYVPQGISLCQNFRNEQGVATSAVCIYGPGMEEFGGIFLGANFGELFEKREQRNFDSSMRLMASSTPLQNQMRQLGALNLTTEDWSYAIHDPRNSLRGSKGSKVARNIRKILAVR